MGLPHTFVEEVFPTFSLWITKVLFHRVPDRCFSAFIRQKRSYQHIHPGYYFYY